MASGRQNALLHNKPRPPCHPLTSFGVPGIFNNKPSVPPHCGSTLGYDSIALAGSKFRYADAPQTTLQVPICYPSSTYNTSIFNCLIKNILLSSRAVCIYLMDS